MQRYALGLGLLLSIGCGNSSNGSSPNGLVVGIVAERTFDADNLGSTGQSLSLAGSGREAVLAWLRQAGNQGVEIAAERFNSSLDSVEEMEPIASPVSGRVSQPSICGGGGGRITAAWGGNMFLSSLPVGVTMDSGYVEASLDWKKEGPRVRVQDDLIGEETVAAVACAPDGSRAITWWHRCLAIDKHGDDDFDVVEPQECASQPSKGSYMQVFGSDGTPVAAPQRLATSDQGYVAAIAAAGRERFVVIAPQSIQVRGKGGELLDELQFNGQLHEHDASVACVGTRCAAALGRGTIRLWIFDVDDLEHASNTVIVERVETAPDEAEYGASPHVACDGNSTCVLTWVSMVGVIEDENFGYDMSIAIAARAFDLGDGRMGDDEWIESGEDLDDGALIASLGKGSFLTARAEIGGHLTLQHLQVE